MGVSGNNHAPADLPPGKRRGTPCTEGLVGLMTGQDGCGKPRPPPGFDPRTVHPVARSHRAVLL